MSNPIELKVNIISVMHRLIDRSLYIEQAIDGLLRVLSQAIPYSTAAIIISNSPEVRFFITRISGDSNSDIEHRIRSFYKTGFDLVSRISQPFAVLQDNPKPLFLDCKALYSIQKEQVHLLGSPIIFAGEVVGAIIVNRFFGDQVPLKEDVQFLSLLASFVAQVLSLESQVKSREEALVRENLALKAKISEEHLGLVCLGKSAASRKLKSIIRKAAPTEAPVLISGEPGTGKRAVAQLIYERSGRASFPFVKVHCSLPEELLEKELFGNGNGNGFLTGSIGIDEHQAARGAFEGAAGGTLMLDEIGDLSTAHQVKLLDMLDNVQAGSFAAGKPKGAEVRIIAVSSTDLFDAAAAGSFRQDLLNRLSTLLVHVPSIRERKSDVPLFIEHFLAQARRELGRETQLNGQVLKKLREREWPGNMAEMKNTVFRLVATADGSGDETEDFTPMLDPIRTTSREVIGLKNIVVRSRLDEMQRKELSAALARNRWIRRRAADDLGLTSRQMNYRIKKFGLDGLIRENRPRRSRSGS